MHILLSGESKTMSETKIQKKSVKILLLSLSFYFMFGYSNVCYLLPIYYGQLGFTLAEGGAMLSAFYFSTMLFRLFLGNLLVQWGFRKFFAAGAVITVASALWCVFSGDSFAATFTARFLYGAGTAFPQIGLATYQSLTFNEYERGRAYSLIMAGGIAPMMTAVPLCDWLLARGHLTLYILVPFIMTAALAVLTLVLLDTSDVKLEKYSLKRRNPFDGFGSCLKIPRLLLALVTMFLFSLADATASFMSSMTASFGLLASYFLSSNAMTAVTMRLFFAKALDRYPRWKVAAPLTFVMTLSMLFAAINPSRISLIILGLIFGVCMGFGFPLSLALVSDCAPRNLQPQANSLTWFLIAVDFTVVPVITSFFGEFTSPVTSFRVTAVLILAATAVTEFFWLRTDKKSQNDDVSQMV